MNSIEEYRPRIKICGLFREEDIQAVNESLPDYCGFVIDFPKSHRNVSRRRAYELRQNLRVEVSPVGVFVDRPVNEVAELMQYGVIDVAQLHGSEDDEYIDTLKAAAPDKEIWKSFIINAGDTKEDIEKVFRQAERSLADVVLLDAGYGYGAVFDHTLIGSFRRPYILAGGITPDNVSDALWSLKPYGVDVSTGVETDNVKDKEKIADIIRLVREVQ